MIDDWRAKWSAASDTYVEFPFGFVQVAIIIHSLVFCLKGGLIHPFLLVFVAPLHKIGRCYEAEICAILLPLRCSFRWYPFLPGSKFSDSGRKP